MAIATREILNIQTVSDVTSELYGSLAYMPKLLRDNPVLTSYTQTLVVGMMIVYDDELVFIQNSQVPSDTQTTSLPVVKSVIIQEQQSIYDIAMQLLGGLEGIFAFIQDNPQLDNLNNYQIRGLSVKCTEQSTALTEYFRIKGITITTGVKPTRNYDDSFDLSFN